MNELCHWRASYKIQKCYKKYKNDNATFNRDDLKLFFETLYNINRHEAFIIINVPVIFSEDESIASIKFVIIKLCYYVENEGNLNNHNLYNHNLTIKIPYETYGELEKLDMFIVDEYKNLEEFIKYRCFSSLTRSINVKQQGLFTDGYMIKTVRDLDVDSMINEIYLSYITKI